MGSLSKKMHGISCLESLVWISCLAGSRRRRSNGRRRRRRHVPALVDLPGADPDHPRVAGSHGERADRGAALPVEEGMPGRARVGGLPDAAVGAAEVEGRGIAGNAGDRGRPAASEGTDEAPVEVGIDGLGHAGGVGRSEREGKQGEMGERLGSSKKLHRKSPFKKAHDTRDWWSGAYLIWAGLSVSWLL